MPCTPLCHSSEYTFMEYAGIHNVKNLNSKFHINHPNQPLKTTIGFYATKTASKATALRLLPHAIIPYMQNLMI